MAKRHMTAKVNKQSDDVNSRKVTMQEALKFCTLFHEGMKWRQSHCCISFVVTVLSAVCQANASDHTGLVLDCNLLTKIFLLCCTLFQKTCLKIYFSMFKIQ